MSSQIDFPGTIGGRYSAPDPNFVIDPDSVNLLNGIGAWYGASSASVELLELPAAASGDVPWGPNVVKIDSGTAGTGRVEWAVTEADFTSKVAVSVAWFAPPTGAINGLALVLYQRDAGDNPISQHNAFALQDVGNPVNVWERVEWSDVDIDPSCKILRVAIGPLGIGNNALMMAANLSARRDGSTVFVPNLNEPGAVDTIDPPGATYLYTPEAGIQIGNPTAPDACIQYRRLDGTVELARLNVYDVIGGAIDA
jgi:hypothetical protein